MRSVAGALAGIALAGSFVFAAFPAVAGESSDAEVRVEVIASRSADPGPAPDPGPGDAPGAGNGSGGSGQLPSAVDPGDPVPGPEEVGVEGVLFVGGLSTAPRPSWNPAGGEVTAWFTVRNVSKSAFDADASFELVGPFGNQISTVDVAIDDLEPGRSRIVRAELPGSGQWGFLTARALLTPPASVDGIETVAVAREASVYAVPWFTATLILGGIGGVLLMRRWRARSAVSVAPVGAVA